MTIASPFSTLGQLLDPAVVGEGARAIRRRVHWEDSAYGLVRDLKDDYTAPPATVAITVRPAEDRDAPFIEGPAAGPSAGEKWERVQRLRLWKAGIGTCYLAVTEDDEPTYMQWLFGHRDNDDVQRYFRGMFPVLEEDTAMVEHAFTAAAHRGKKIMPAAMARIAEQAPLLGARYVVTFVGGENSAALKGSARAGFAVYTERRQTVRWGRRRVEYVPDHTAV